MKKLLLVLLVLTSLLLLVNCKGPDGEASLKYWWTGTLYAISDTNPSTPATIYNNQYFKTNTGTFRTEYVSWDGSGWWINYTITVNEGEPFFEAGADTWYEIALYSYGPVLYEWDYARSIISNERAEETLTAAPFLPKSKEPISEGKVIGEILGTDEIVSAKGSIRIEYGRIFDK
jgi:hypothetical protein